MDTLKTLRQKQAQTVNSCRMELKYLKQNKDKALEIRELLSSKEAQLSSSKENVQRIENQIDPLEVRHQEFVTAICCLIWFSFYFLWDFRIEVFHF